MHKKTTKKWTFSSALLSTRQKWSDNLKKFHVHSMHLTLTFKEIDHPKMQTELGWTIPLRLGVCLNLVIIKRGRWSSICRTQTCRQASACAHNLLPHKDTSWSIPAPTHSRTNSCMTLTEPLAFSYSYRACRERRTRRERRQDSIPSHTPVSLTSTCLECRWYVLELGDNLKSQNRGDA